MTNSVGFNTLLPVCNVNLIFAEAFALSLSAPFGRAINEQLTDETMNLHIK